MIVRYRYFNRSIPVAGSDPEEFREKWCDFSFVSGYTDKKDQKSFSDLSPGKKMSRRIEARVVPYLRASCRDFGRWRVNVLPVCNLLSTVISPPCICIIFFAMDRERPIRSNLRESFVASASWNGSKIDDNAFSEIPVPLARAEI